MNTAVMNTNTLLGLINYTRLSHPEFYDQILNEYANYINWLSSTFLRPGHVYKKVSKSGKVTLYTLDDFKPALNEKSLKLTYTYIVHLSIYKSDDEYETGNWYTLDELYKMMLEDVTPKYGVQDIPDSVPCKFNWRILSETKNELKIIRTNYYHHSHIDYHYYDEKTPYNRHFCECEYKLYIYKLVDGEWENTYKSYPKKFRLAADNSMGWCHDTATDRNSLLLGKYDGCWKNLREAKREFLGVDSLANCKTLFDDINFLDTYMFTPYPIKENKW